MSTVPEAIAANHAGDEGAGDFVRHQHGGRDLAAKTGSQEVLETGERVRDTLAKLLAAIVPKLV